MNILTIRRRYKEDVLPRGYTRLDYVENTSNSYFVTDITINNNDIIEIEFTPSEYTGLKFICGGSNGPVGDTKFFLATTLQQWNKRPATTYTFIKDVKYNVRIGYGLFEVNGQTISMREGIIDDVAFALFSDSLGDSRRFLGKIHSVRVDGKIDFIPCKSDTNIIGFYNTKNNNFYISKTAPFTGG